MQEPNESVRRGLAMILDDSQLALTARQDYRIKCACIACSLDRAGGPPRRCSCGIDGHFVCEGCRRAQDWRLALDWITRLIRTKQGETT